MAKNQQDNDSTMDIFEGWETPSDENFFDAPDAQTGDTDDTPEPAQPDNTDDAADTDDKAETNDDTTKEDEFDFFGETDLDEDDNSEATDDSEDDSDDVSKDASAGSNISMLNSLKERGLLDYELEEGEELDEERAGELIEDRFEASIEDRLGGLLQGLPPLTQQLIKFASNGGNEQEFLAQAMKQPSVSITKDMDLKDAKNAELVIKTQLEADGHDEEYITANIEFLKDSGKLSSMAEKVHPKMIAKDEAERAATLEKVATQKAAMKDNQRKFKADLVSKVNELSEVKGFTLSAKDKKDLPNYMADTTVQNGNSKVSQFQKDLYDTLQDKDNAVLLAKLVRSKFDFSELVKNATTKKVKDIQGDVRRSRKTASSGSSQTSAKKNLADYFN